MMDRCYDSGHTEYKRYGERGVTVCDEWRDNLLAFIEWSLANGWARGLQLDKDILCKELGIDPPVYSPETCQWVTKRVNVAAATSRDNFGRHPNVKLSHKQADDLVIPHFIHGETKAELARKFGIGFSSVSKIIAKSYEPV